VSLARWFAKRSFRRWYQARRKPLGGPVSSRVPGHAAQHRPNAGRRADTRGWHRGAAARDGRRTEDAASHRLPLVSGASRSVKETITTRAASARLLAEGSRRPEPGGGGRFRLRLPDFDYERDYDSDYNYPCSRGAQRAFQWRRRPGAGRIASITPADRTTAAAAPCRRPPEPLERGPSRGPVRTVDPGRGRRPRTKRTTVPTLGWSVGRGRSSSRARSRDLVVRDCRRGRRGGTSWSCRGWRRSRWAARGGRRG